MCVSVRVSVYVKVREASRKCVREVESVSFGMKWMEKRELECEGLRFGVLLR